MSFTHRLAPDIGSLQGLQKIIGNQSFVREMVFTAKEVYSAEAKEMGLVSKVCEDADSLYEASIKVADQIAKKSPVAGRSLNEPKFDRIFSKSIILQLDVLRCAGSPMNFIETNKTLSRSISRSPAVQGSKINLDYSREHKTYDGLRYNCNWNMAMLQSEDLIKSVAVVMSKDKEADFEDL